MYKDYLRKYKWNVIMFLGYSKTLYISSLFKKVLKSKNISVIMFKKHLYLVMTENPLQYLKITFHITNPIIQCSSQAYLYENQNLTQGFFQLCSIDF